LLIRHSKYTVLNCRKYIPTDCFYGDFAHWNRPGNQLITV